MKLGVLADIHSNSRAFAACLERLEAENCDEYLLLGDYVSDTPYTEETLRMLYDLLSRETCRALRGNREDYMISQRRILRGEQEGQKWLNNSASGNLLFTFRRLTDRDLDFFESLPVSFRYEKEDFPAITCCHGSPGRTGELLQADGENTKEWMDRIDTDYLIAAHTHYPGVTERNDRLYINPGSVGIAIDDPGLARCAILHGREDGKAWIPELLSVPYDAGEVVRDIFRSGLFDSAPWFVNNNLHTLITGIDRTPQMVERAMELQTAATGIPAVWPKIGEQYFEQASREMEIPDYGRTFAQYRDRHQQGENGNGVPGESPE